ncbi:hypothetical protein ES703_68105 [subsurface metagenome]
MCAVAVASCQKEPPSHEREAKEETPAETKAATELGTGPAVADISKSAYIPSVADGNTFHWIDINTLEPMGPQLIKIAKHVNIDRWPQSNVRRTAPLFDVSLLDRPTRASRVNNSFSFLLLRDGVWGYQDWHGDDGAGKKNWLWVRIYLSPHSQAAHEICMLGTMTPLPAESWIWHYSKASGPNDLGDLSFDRFSSSRTGRTVEFFCDNLYVKIRGTGVFVDEVLPLAYKLDKLIQQRPALTYEQLLARRPKVVIHNYDPKVRTHLGGKALRYTATSPAGTRIIRTHAKVNGAFAGAADGFIDLARQEGPISAELTAITNELLANTTRREMVIRPGPRRKPTRDSNESTTE